MDNNAMLIGFIGQGWIGKSYADDFERRGYRVVRYSLEEPYAKNKDRIKDCDIVFIAVPTPTTPKGFDDSVLQEVLLLVGDRKIAVIKSTVLPGMTESLQDKYKEIYILHAPEFLTTVSADYDVAHPIHNIIGIPTDNREYRDLAQRVLDILPSSKSELICQARSAELFKYLRNCFFYTKNVYMNILYDMAQLLGVEWETVYRLMDADPWISAEQHAQPIHKEGRGAGGYCLIKDFAALRGYLEKHLPEESESIATLKSIEVKNVSLLRDSEKDIDLLDGIYGKQKGEKT